MTVIEALKNQPLFSWISNTPLEYLVEKAETRPMKEDEILYEPESSSDAIYLILEGEVKFLCPSGKYKTLGHGQIFGECFLIEVQKRSCEAKVLKSGSLLILDHEALYQFSQEFPDPYSIVITNLARYLSDHIKNLNEKKVSSEGPKVLA